MFPDMTLCLKDSTLYLILRCRSCICPLPGSSDHIIRIYAHAKFLCSFHECITFEYAFPHLDYLDIFMPNY